METGLIGDHHMKRLRIGLSNLLEEELVDIAINGRGEQQLAGVLTVDFQCFVQIAPFVAGGIRCMHTRAPADHRQQSVAMFVEHLLSYRLHGRWSDHLGQ
jgi:hypothetical protein